MFGAMDAVFRSAATKRPITDLKEVCEVFQEWSVEYSADPGFCSMVVEEYWPPPLEAVRNDSFKVSSLPAKFSHAYVWEFTGDRRLNRFRHAGAADQASCPALL